MGTRKDWGNENKVVVFYNIGHYQALVKENLARAALTNGIFTTREEKTVWYASNDDRSIKTQLKVGKDELQRQRRSLARLFHTQKNYGNGFVWQRALANWRRGELAQSERANSRRGSHSSGSDDSKRPLETQLGFQSM